MERFFTDTVFQAASFNFGCFRRNTGAYQSILKIAMFFIDAACDCSSRICENKVIVLIHFEKSVLF